MTAHQPRSKMPPDDDYAHQSKEEDTAVEQLAVESPSRLRNIGNACRDYRLLMRDDATIWAFATPLCIAARRERAMIICACQLVKRVA